MIPDIRLSADFFHHPKIVTLRQRCGAEGVLAYLALLCHARVHAPSGDLPTVSPTDLARLSGFPGDPETLALALLAACPGRHRGLLHALPGGGFRIVGWVDRQPFAMQDAHRHRPAGSRSEAARLAGLASAAKRAREGWVRDPATGRFKPPVSPNDPPNDHRTSVAGRHPNDDRRNPLSHPTIHQTAPNAPTFPTRIPPSPLPERDPPAPPRRNRDRQPWDPDATGPRPPVPGDAFRAMVADAEQVRASIQKAAAAGPLSPRNVRALADAERLLRMHAVPFDPFPFTEAPGDPQHPPVA